VTSAPAPFGNRATQRRLVDQLNALASPLEIYPPEGTFHNETLIRDLRRARRARGEDAVGMIALTEVDGVLVWEEGPGTPRIGGRRALRGTAAPGDIIAQYKFERLQPSQFVTFLDSIDSRLTPVRGLRQLGSDLSLKKVVWPAKGRALLLLHGTFANSELLLAELTATAEGKSLLQRARKHYDAVLSFDHPTLAVSPLLNALDLVREFHAWHGPIDLVCHGSGGLVARWWLEVLTPAPAVPRRAVLVGSPLGGTSLAAPARLRSALSLLTNLGRTLTMEGDAVNAAASPLLEVSLGLMRLLASASSFVEHTPLLDAGIALTPGLAAMSRIGSHPELRRLRAADHALPAYFAVRSDFQSEQPGWSFWKYFVRTKERLKDIGADAIFEGPNDLVVDTESMIDLREDAQVLEVRDFGTNDVVHHANYFRQKATLEFIADSLGIP